MRGFSTVEILIAIAILSTTLVAVVLVSFGDQSLLAQSSMNAGALQQAQGLLEQEEANGRKDFRLVNTVAPTSTGAYQMSVQVAMWPGDPYTTKRISATVSWQDEMHISRSVSLSELLSDFSDPTTLDTCQIGLSGDWSHPQSVNRILGGGDLLPSSAPAGHTFSPTDPIAALDAYHGILYVATASTTSATNDSFFIFDISHQGSIQYLGSTDNNAASTKGIAAIAVAGTYAYAANPFGANFKTCKAAANCGQLQIFNIAVPAAIPTPSNFLIPTSSAPYVIGSGGQAAGQTLFYQDGYVYLGLTKTGGGPEFNIINVHDPLHPQWVGGFPVGNTIDQIYVRNGYAYLATDDKSRELIILDVHDPTAPAFVSSFDPAGTLGYETGQSVYVVGDTIYTGMSAAGGFPELYVLNIGHNALPRVAGSSVIGSTILGMFADDTLAFLLASTIHQFQIFDISDPAAIRQYAPAVSLPGVGAALDCEGNDFYAASNNGSQGNLSVIFSSP